ncbi:MULTISPECIES: hypothetical protein [unclassified Polaribacter]|uniref:hypothetical protein n=1 Tax=unclassified Polaribacter TaxID=196858 RepID=UPI0011BE6CD0|nr:MULTISPECIES: hypothetical protein [unclassified Polaribacter]TXD52413.1 hypothetical protein ES043_08440 [Polaribacter sp. IC063]TXD61050.1 hypothetical protein ES044_05710 [Polaribacter sp. IC066]
MKNLKFILTLIICVSISSCGDDTSAPPFTLSSANIAGNYTINSINEEEEETATSNSGTVVNVSTTTFVGDSFDDINFILNANGTYTASGKYRIVITETPNGGTPVNDFEIAVFDATGSYQINNIDNTITFNPSTGDFIEGLFTVITFTETSIKMTQEETDVDGGITTTLKANISLVRK